MTLIREERRFKLAIFVENSRPRLFSVYPETPPFPLDTKI
jgi:hypothetical protein